MFKKMFYSSRVRLGEHRLSTDPDCANEICNETPQDFDVDEIVFHPDYGLPAVFRNDIALIRLSRPANFTGKISQIIDQKQMGTNSNINSILLFLEEK